VKRRIIVSIVGVTVIALLVLGIPLAVAVARLYENEEVLRLEREANEARSAVSTSELTRGEPIKVESDGNIRFLVYDAHGLRVGGGGPDRPDVTVRSALSGDSADARINGRIVVAVPINGDEKVVGALRASRSADVVAGRTRGAWLIMGGIALGAVIVAALLAWWQARRLTRPIDELVDTARRLGGGDFSVRTRASGVGELDQLGTAFNTTADRLGNLVSRERTFSSDASHQLRTPIAGLRVKVESALLSTDADARAALEDLLPPIDRLETTVEDLLRLARDADVDRSPLDVAGLLREAEDHWHGPLAARGRPLRVVVEDDLPSVVVAEPAIRQILEVLISNAERHGAGVVTVSARSSVPGAIVIQVGDEGASSLDARRIFERRTDGGHGVGLALARALADAEGARLVLERPGPQPIFALVIPAASQ
jgi:signal transduction histidine kinase